MASGLPKWQRDITHYVVMVYAVFNVTTCQNGNMLFKYPMLPKIPAVHKSLLLNDL